MPEADAISLPREVVVFSWQPAQASCYFAPVAAPHFAGV
jgi:hypothetical protein